MQVNSHILEHAIVVWMNEIKKIGLITYQVDTIYDIQDGIVFSQLLNAVDPSFFPLDQTKALLQSDQKNNNMVIHRHLLDIQNKVVQYRSNIQCKNDPFYVDVLQISNQQSIPQLLAFFEMVLRVVMSSQLKGEIIKPILGLKEVDQEALMHFLKKLLQQEDEDQYEGPDDWNITGGSDHNLAMLISKGEQMENENIKLQNQIVDQRDEISDLKQTTKYLQTLLDSKEQDFQNLMEQTYEERGVEKSSASSEQVIHITHEEDRLRQRILQQEHRLTELELTLDDHRQKESQYRQLKEENETYIKQLIQQNALKNKFETFKESRDVEKETHNNVLSQKDKQIANLKQNITNILQDLSAEKEKSLDFQVQHEKTKALIEKLSLDKIRTEQECGDKIMSMERFIQLLKEEHELDSSILERQQSSSPNHHNLEAEMHRSDIITKQENLQVEFYKNENNKLENKLKALQAQLERMELQLENKKQANKEYETIVIQNQQLEMLREEQKKDRLQYLKLKVQFEEHKKLSQEKRPQIIDAEIELLKDLDVELRKYIKQQRIERSNRKEIIS